MAGLFITFEGGEGSGKTTQINRLGEALIACGHRVTTTREPGGTPEAEKIRDCLVQREGGNWSPMAEALMMFAAREMHYKTVISRALIDGKMVICDRFTDSTRAYQGYGHGLPLDVLEQLKTIAIGDVEPDLTFILDIPVEEGLKRSGERAGTQATPRLKYEDRFENMDTAFHERLRQGFLEIAKQNPQRCRVIQAAQPMEAVSAEILSILLEKMGEG